MTTETKQEVNLPTLADAGCDSGKYVYRSFQISEENYAAFNKLSTDYDAYSKKFLFNWVMHKTLKELGY